ncbi:MAG: DUF433 domain-containing protein [Nannocystales bacterium]
MDESLHSALDDPRYRVADAARGLGIPVATVRSWVRGRSYRTRDGAQHFERILITPADGILSFRNLVELQVLRALRTGPEIRIGVIRRAIRFMRDTLQIESPLASGKMMHDGTDLFVNYIRSTLDAGTGQVVIRRAIEEHLQRVDWADGIPRRIYPFPPDDGPQDVRAIVLDPEVRYGQPVITGTRIPLRVVTERRDAGETVAAIAKDYGRTRGEIRQALRFAA